MPKTNPPAYESIEQQVRECVLAKRPDATEAQINGALKKMEKFWPKVDWTKIPILNMACSDAADYGIANPSTKPGRKKGSKAPANKISDAKSDQPEDLKEANVNENINIDP